MIRNTRRESQDDYVNVIYTNGDHRVALCRDGLQWLLQKHSGQHWKSISFCVTATALAREWRNKVGTATPPEIAVALPDAYRVAAEAL